MTAMYCAAFNGHHDIVHLLADANANVNLQEKVYVWLKRGRDGNDVVSR